MKTYMCYIITILCFSSCRHQGSNDNILKKPCETHSVCPNLSISHWVDDDPFWGKKGEAHFSGDNTATILEINFLDYKNNPCRKNYAKLLSLFKTKKDSLCCLKRVNIYTQYDLNYYRENRDSIETFLKQLQEIHLQYFYLNTAGQVNNWLQYLDNVDSIEINTYDTALIDINTFLKTSKQIEYLDYLYSGRSLEWDKNPIGCEVREKILFDTSLAKLNTKLEYIGINASYSEEYFFKKGKILRTEINKHPLCK